MKTITTLIFGFILLGSALPQTVIYMEKEGGVYSVPCKVNGLDLRFIFDTGVSSGALGNVGSDGYYWSSSVSGSGPGSSLH